MSAAPSEHSFLFADLCGFTALTEIHGDEDAADLAGGFSMTPAVSSASMRRRR